jgi:M6 family metalloprotease-like protein
VRRPAGVAAFAAVLAVFVISDLPSPSAAASPVCTPPNLGFGAGEGANAAQLPPTTGELRIAMLFVDFSDSPGSVTPRALFDSYVPRVVDWYRRVSYGRLQIRVEPLLRWLRLPRTLDEYDRLNFEGAAEAAVAAADADVDFARYDALYLVPSMPSLASTIVDDVPIRVDGSAIHSWSWLATGSLQRLPFVAIHETGHVLGLPDLYGSVSNQSRWDVMSAAARGGGMFAWHRWKLGWLDASQIVCVVGRGRTQVVLTPIERAGGRKAIVSRVGRTAIVVEVRRPEAEDASLCLGGVLVYRVDFVAGSPEKAGSRLRPIQLHQARADDSRRTTRCGSEYRAPLGLGRGRVGRATAWGHDILLVKRLQGSSYRVRVTRA